MRLDVVFLTSDVARQLLPQLHHLHRRHHQPCGPVALIFCIRLYWHSSWMFMIGNSLDIERYLKGISPNLTRKVCMSIRMYQFVGFVFALWLLMYVLELGAIQGLKQTWLRKQPKRRKWKQPLNRHLWERSSVMRLTTCTHSIKNAI